MPLLVRTLFLSACMCTFCAPAIAQTSAREQKARVHYAKGRVQYDLGEYDQAIAEFKEAYAIASLPGLLYDIAQAYRKKGDCRLALATYVSYQRLEANPHDPELLQRQIDEMEQCTRALERQAATVPSTTVTINNPTQPVVDLRAGRGLRWS